MDNYLRQAPFQPFPRKQKLKTPLGKGPHLGQLISSTLDANGPSRQVKNAKVFASTLEETMNEDSSDSLEAQRVPRCTPEVDRGSGWRSGWGPGEMWTCWKKSLQWWGFYRGILPKCLKDSGFRNFKSFFQNFGWVCFPTFKLMILVVTSTLTFFGVNYFEPWGRGCFPSICLIDFIEQMRNWIGGCTLGSLGYRMS